MHNMYHKDFFLHNSYTKRLSEVNIKVANDRENAALYIKRAEIHKEFNNETAALSDLLIADSLDKKNIKVVGALMVLFFNKGEYIKSNEYKIKFKLLEHQLRNNNCQKISIHNLLNKENYVPNIQEEQYKSARKY